MSKNILAKGIDISNAGQGKIADWSKVAKNIDFAVIKACNCYQSDPNDADAEFKTNADACEKYGIPYGVYVYQYFTTVGKAKEAAEFTISLLKGRKLTYPVFLDLEEQKVADLGKAKILELAKTFCYYIEKAGYTFGVYANKNWFTNYLTDSWYDSKIKWLAQYNSTVTYTGKYDIWQYSSTGSVTGISGKVDMNFCYLSFVKGDVDGDGKVTAADARKILRISSKLDKASGQTAKNADVNSDGSITAADAREALRQAAKIRNS